MTTAGKNGAADIWAGARWKRAAACGEAGCVEVAFAGDRVAVRDGKGTVSAVLTFGVGEWQAFVRGVQAGDFDA